MQPTAQKNNAKQRKTIAIIAMIAVAAIALAAVASAFNGVKVVQRYNFDPVKYTFAPYLAYIRQIRETWIHSWVISPECASGARSHFLTKSATCSTLFPNRHLPNPITKLRRIHHDAPSQTFPSDALYWPWAR